MEHNCVFERLDRYVIEKNSYRPIFFDLQKHLPKRLETKQYHVLTVLNHFK